MLEHFFVFPGRGTRILDSRSVRGDPERVITLVHKFDGVEAPTNKH